MSSAFYFNLDQSRILSSGNGLSSDKGNSRKAWVVALASMNNMKYDQIIMITFLKCPFFSSIPHNSVFG